MPDIVITIRYLSACHWQKSMAPSRNFSAGFLALSVVDLSDMVVSFLVALKNCHLARGQGRASPLVPDAPFLADQFDHVLEDVGVYEPGRRLACPISFPRPPSAAPSLMRGGTGRGRETPPPGDRGTRHDLAAKRPPPNQYFADPPPRVE
jgi:hypothetical protein